MNERYCAGCGSPLEPEVQFCPACGCIVRGTDIEATMIAEAETVKASTRIRAAIC